MTEQQFRKALEDNVVEVDNVNDVPFGVLVVQISKHLWRGTDNKLATVTPDDMEETQAV